MVPGRQVKQKKGGENGHKHRQTSKTASSEAETGQFPKRGANGQFVRGTSSNLKGRPLGSRNRF
jgi:hypothetical protein